MQDGEFEHLGTFDVLFEKYLGKKKQKTIYAPLMKNPEVKYLRMQVPSR
jgi:hypothetical protein